MSGQEAIPLDRERAKHFSAKMADILNHGMLAIMISLGHRLGLFDAMEGLAPTSSDGVAQAADLSERHVREWLGAMVTGGIVDHDPDAGTYHLPPEHARGLARSAGIHNSAVFAQYIPMLGKVEDAVADTFRSGGGVPYSAFGDFHAIMADESRLKFDATLTEVVVPLVEGMHERLEAGADVLDIGCGSGHAMNLLAAAYPASRFAGFDFSEEAVAAARAEAAGMGLDNVAFEVRDVAAIDEHDRYDVITTFDAIHDQADPAAVLAGIAAALRPDGVYLCVDIRASSRVENNLDHVLGPFLYTVSTMHCMSVSLAQGGAGLGTVWGEELAREMLTEAGFGRIDVQRVKGDQTNNYYVARLA